MKPSELDVRTTHKSYGIVLNISSQERELFFIAALAVCGLPGPEGRLDGDFTHKWHALRWEFFGDRVPDHVPGVNWEKSGVHGAQYREWLVEHGRLAI